MENPHDFDEIPLKSAYVENRLELLRNEALNIFD